MGAFIDTLAEQGGNIAGNVVNAGMGLLLGKIQDKRQLKQQKKLQDLQIAGNMQMGDYNYGKQLQMWKDTSYPAQMEQLKAAGLNPALMYGMGGGGGQSTGSAGPGVQGGTAPTGGGEAMGMTMAGIQAKLLEAQEANIRANTEKTKVDTAKTAGVDTTKAGAETELIKTNTAIAKLDEWIKGKSAQDQTEIIMWQAEKILNEVEKEARENITNKATQNDRIDTVKAELAAKALMPYLIKAQTTTEKGKPALQQAEITKMQADVQNTILARMQKWREIEISGGKAGAEERAQMYKQLADELKAPIEIVEQVINGIILKQILTPAKQGPTPIRGLHNR